MPPWRLVLPVALLATCSSCAVLSDIGTIFTSSADASGFYMVREDEWDKLGTTDAARGYAAMRDPLYGPFTANGNVPFEVNRQYLLFPICGPKRVVRWNAGDRRSFVQGQKVTVKCR